VDMGLAFHVLTITCVVLGTGVHALVSGDSSGFNWLEAVAEYIILAKQHSRLVAGLSLPTVTD
jgi:hypothetical protein